MQDERLINQVQMPKDLEFDAFLDLNTEHTFIDRDLNQSQSDQFENTEQTPSQIEQLHEQDHVSHPQHELPEEGSHYSFRPLVEEEGLSMAEDIAISHECGCLNDNDCNGAHCSCFLTPTQICVLGLCCNQCIQSKNIFLRQTRGFQLQEERMTQQLLAVHRILAEMRDKNCTNIHYFKHINPQDNFLKTLTFCTCKKSLCQKKYCTCFERGLKCGPLCFCQDCQNQEEEKQDEKSYRRQELRWQRYAIGRRQASQAVMIDQDIEQYLEQSMFEKDGLSEVMEFEPPNFSVAFPTML